MFLRAPVVVVSSFLGIYLSQQVVVLVETGSIPEQIIARVASISLGLMIALVIEKILSASLEELIMVFDFKIQIELIDVLMLGDYENNESPSGLTRLSKAMACCSNDWAVARQVSRLISSILANLLGVICYTMLLFKFNRWILLAVTITTVAGFGILKASADWNYKNKDNWKADERKIEYLLGNAGDFSKAKDIRLYGLSEWFADVFKITLGSRMAWAKKEQLYNFKADGLRALLSLFRDVIAYGLLVYVLSKKGLSGGDFILYFGIIGGFATWLNGIVNDFSQLYKVHLGFAEMREFVDYPSKVNNGEGIPVPKETFSIEFKNVSYRYEGSETMVIQDLNFKIARGEKLAIVGVNGAGKTTLVKLMCGLYTPTKGEILIDGNPISAYNQTEYYQLLSAVFQDIFVMPQSITNNIAAGDYENANQQRIIEVLEMAGLYDKIESLPEKLETRLIKSVHKEGIDFSGGEMQKLALARALYKEGKALILDEPTAALDPIAESKVYTTYNEMTKGHTAVFISHRLASTRFCDRIFLLDNGYILEEGTHESLMNQEGKYYEMFEMQSHYYKEEVAEDVI